MTTKQFITLHKRFEHKYRKLFYALLMRQFKSVADEYEETGVFNKTLVKISDLQKIYKQLYVEIMPYMAMDQYNTTVLPVENKYKQKDLFDFLSSLLNLSDSGVTIDVFRNLSSEWYKANILTRITKVDENTIKILGNIIQKSIEEGKGATDIARQIRTSTGLNKRRSLTIARTETVAAMNKGRVLAMHSSALEWGKRWVSTHDKRTRHSHHIVGEIKDYRFLNDFYEVPLIEGGFDTMYYPGDPNGSAENVINCRCTEVYEVIRDLNGRPLRKKPVASIQEFVMAI